MSIEYELKLLFLKSLFDLISVIGSFSFSPYYIWLIVELLEFDFDVPIVWILCTWATFLFD